MQVGRMVSDATSESINLDCWIGVAFLIAFLVVPVMAVTVANQIYTTTLRAGIKVVEGRAKLDAGESVKRLIYSVSIDDTAFVVQKPVFYSVSIGDTRFYVEKPVFLAFKNGDPYRIYYAPGSNTILSAEWLRGAD